MGYRAPGDMWREGACCVQAGEPHPRSSPGWMGSMRWDGVGAPCAWLASWEELGEQPVHSPGGARRA